MFELLPDITIHMGFIGSIISAGAGLLDSKLAGNSAKSAASNSNQFTELIVTGKHYF